jgi:hypothetical protein
MFQVDLQPPALDHEPKRDDGASVLKKGFEMLLR